MGPDSLHDVLERSRELGLLGPGPVEPQIRHAEAFVELLDTILPRTGGDEGRPGPTHVLDLGSGGGLPGLVIAVRRPDVRLTLLDGSERRTAVLHDAVRRLGVGADVEILTARAESAARQPTNREQFDAVVARSFGPPAVVAECAVGFLRPGGHLIVSEPESGDDRWPADPLAELGLEIVGRFPEPGRVLLRRTSAPLDPAIPRRDGRPAQRPRF